MKTAVILTARKERDFDIPYSLQPFAEDTCLIDRTLHILSEYGYHRIYIIVGYRAELFQKYETNDVKILFNKNYEFTSSMGSLAMIKEYVDGDFLLIEGDTFYEKEVVEKLSKVKSGNCFVMTEECGNGDECFVETKSGFVTKISKDRHRITRFEGELLGVSRISLETFDKIMDAWEHSDNPYLNYEYLLMDVTETVERPILKFQNLLWGEVDNKRDFERLKNDIYPKLRRKENPFDKENIISYLSNIFPNRNVSNATVQKIGGMSNKNFRVGVFDKNYVLRVPGNGAEGMIDRTNEEFNANEICKLGVNPRTLYFNPSSGIKLTEYIDNAETLNSATIQRHENMRKIAVIYKKIHGANIRLRNEFNIFKEIDKYDMLMKNIGAVMYDGYKEVRDSVMTLEHYLNKMGVILRPCHNDAVPENFIKSKDGVIYLIDWEYSGMNDPMADFAALFLESDFTEENQDYMLDEYFTGYIPEYTKEKIICYQILWDYLWSQWTVIKERKGDDFGTYGIDRFNRVKLNLEKLGM